MIGILRCLLGIQRRLAREDAVRIAEQHCAVTGLPWVLPVRVVERLRVFEVWTRADCVGGNAIIRIDVETGEVVKAILTPR